MKVSVVVPIYNEVHTLPEFLRRVKAAPLDKEILIVDDGSTDGTRQRLKELAHGQPGIRLFFHDDNRGKGAALRTGFAQARGEFIIVQDADLEYDPRDYPHLLEPLLAGRADVVYGSRFLGGPRRVLFFWHDLGNRLLTFLTNLLCDLDLTDMETGFKAFRRDVLQRIRLTADRFGFEPEFTVKAARLRLRIYETPIRYDGRDYSEGKKVTWKDGVAALFLLFRYRFFK